MALTSCTECGGKVSTNASSCPHCGNPPPRTESPQLQQAIEPTSPPQPTRTATEVEMEWAISSRNHKPVLTDRLIPHLDDFVRNRLDDPLDSLDIEGTSWTSRDMTKIAKLKGLTKLRIYMPEGLSNQILLELAKIISLTELRINPFNDRVTGAGLRALAQLTNLERLEISDAKMMAMGGNRDFELAIEFLRNQLRRCSIS